MSVFGVGVRLYRRFLVLLSLRVADLRFFVGEAYSLLVFAFSGRGQIVSGCVGTIV